MVSTAGIKMDIPGSKNFQSIEIGTPSGHNVPVLDSLVGAKLGNGFFRLFI